MILNHAKQQVQRLHLATVDCASECKSSYSIIWQAGNRLEESQSNHMMADAFLVECVACAVDFDIDIHGFCCYHCFEYTTAVLDAVENKPNSS
jgi:hypothetical protein